MYIAHKKGEATFQTVSEHLHNVARLAARFAAPLSAGECAFCCGMLHDLGKYSEEFRHRILDNGPRVDHSTAGAQALCGVMKNGLARLMAYCIAGHHSGLPDGGSSSDTAAAPTLMGRLKKVVPDYASGLQEVSIPSVLPKNPPPLSPVNGGFTMAFFTRMLYSCLVDADFLDTEAFMADQPPQRGMGEPLSDLWQKLARHLQTFYPPKTSLNQKRCDILDDCQRAAEEAPGLFSLTVPTGGGKTLSSLAFALKHAIQHGLQRVIYVIPYTSIIEQTAQVFRDILGDENVLEHHSNVCFRQREEDEVTPAELASENWDAPVVVTTNVQFFESLFSNRSSRCRKLHNIARSVVIFDEAQMLPRDYLLPCVGAITELCVNCGCTAILCTATQPALDPFFPDSCRPREICQNTDALYRFFRRTQLLSVGERTDAQLAAGLAEAPQVLCIVNSRAQAQNLYQLLPPEGRFHLSTLLYPNHRKRILKAVRKRLKEGLPCRVVSTSLIEAGVDVDFPLVYRSEAGLDSDIQAAGRCNREGKRPLEESLVKLFVPEERYRKHLPAALRTPLEVARLVAARQEDLASSRAIHDYFSQLFYLQRPMLDRKGILPSFERGARNLLFPFAQVAAEFHLIESPTQTILIPLEEEAAQLAEDLQLGFFSRERLRRAGLYSVNVYQNQFRALWDSGKLELLADGLYLLRELDCYSEEMGLTANVETGDAIFA